MHGILSYKTWLIEPMFANRMAPLVLRSIEQGTTEKFFQQNRESNDKKVSRLYGGIDAEREWPDDGPSYYVAVSKSKKNVAIVSMIGSITKNGESCSYGMRDYENTLAHIAKDERISGVVIHFNNAPGGSHDGTPEISEIIANYPKSIIAFVDGYAASAHYYMASQSDHIMMNSKTDSEVGSIGSLIVMENIQNMVNAGNFPKIEIIRAPQSVNKALVNAIEELPKGARAELNADLKKTVDGFIAAVKSGRGDVLKDDGLMFTGQMYATDDAIGNGLADSKGTLQDAINLAADMKAAIPVQSKSSSTNKTNMSLKSKVSSFFGKTQKKSAEAAAAEPAEDTTPMWTDTMVFNTDGSGDGAFCLHPDSDGNDRKFETKTDGNKGNEPPTDPATTEDNNWSVVAEPAAEPAAEEKAEAKVEETSVAKLNVALKASNAKAKEESAKVASLTAEVAQLKADNKALQTKLDAKPAADATEVPGGDDDSQEETATDASGKEASEYKKAMNDNFL